MKIVGVILFLLFFQNSYSQVGIGTTDPQQKLHIASSTGTLRVESLDYQNNVFNGGDVDNDGDFTNNTFPLFVDKNGDLTLLFKPLLNSEDLDAFNDSTLPNSTVSLSSNDADGKASTVITTYSITVKRASVLELKYNISFDVYLNSSGDIITDGLARRIETFIKVTDQDTGFVQDRKYGSASKCYTSASANSVAGTFYNSCTTYITLPAASTYVIEFNGLVSSNVRAGSQGNLSESTYVEFATGQDFVFARLH